MQAEEKTWTLYLLYHSESNRTYLGVTTDVARRLRQHRGEISGGARFTTRIQKVCPECVWALVATLSQFPGQSEVTRWERLLKIKTRGLKQRLEAMKDISEGRHPKSFTPKMVEKYVLPSTCFVEFQKGEQDVFNENKNQVCIGCQ
jgi:predicted GIY-YIG superfamily endonuclease